MVKKLLLDVYMARIIIMRIFFVQVFSRLASLDCNNVILGSDLNCFLNPTMDKSPSVILAPQVSSLICKHCHEQNLFDIWRFYNPTSKEFTFSHPHQTTSCIYYIFISCYMAHLVRQANVGPITISDHARSLSLYASRIAQRPVDF